MHSQKDSGDLARADNFKKKKKKKMKKKKKYGVISKYQKHTQEVKKNTF